MRWRTQEESGKYFITSHWLLNIAEYKKESLEKHFKEHTNILNGIVLDATKILQKTNSKAVELDRRGVDEKK